MLLSWAYARAEASYLAATEYTAFLWAALFGWLVFGEPLSPFTVAGAALIVAGVAGIGAVVDHASWVIEVVRWLGVAFLLGGVFVGIKVVEFHDKFSEGITLSTNSFYMFYLALTFFHFMHVLMGMVILAFVIAKAWRGGYSRQDEPESE